MELKVRAISNTVTAIKGFNRTFMELKVRIGRQPISGETFQSHLYGIERRIAQRVRILNIRFQSHLYGIESIEAINKEVRTYVSIAPLWN